jgi:predicted TIM-barrel fold metal-dependent hydrolase
LFETARAKNRFVILHTGCFNTVVYKHQGEADPREWEPLFEEFPTVRVCLAHMNRDRPDRAWELMKRHKQLFADTSWQPADAIRRAIEAVGAERILLGSDWPLLHPDLQGDAVRALRKGATSAQADQVANASAESFLG